MELAVKAEFHLRNIQYQIGLTGLLGAFLLLLTFILFCAFTLPQKDELQQVQQSLTQTSRQLPALNTLPSDGHFDNSHDFLARFPSVSEKEKSIKTLIDLAEQYHLPIDSGQYETIIKEADGMTEVQISFPLKGNYPSIQRFLAETLNALPNAALTGLALHRNGTQSNQLDAEIVTSLYFNSLYFNKVH